MHIRRVVALVLSIGLVASKLMSTPATAAEVARCSDPEVMSLVRTAVTEWSQVAMKYAPRTSPGTYESFRSFIETWAASTEVSAIRQTAYDRDNNVRYCIANIKRTPLKPEEVFAVQSTIAMIGGMLATTEEEKRPFQANCTGESSVITYKIEVPESDYDFYMSWMCQ